MATVALYGRYEIVLETSIEYFNPVQDVEIAVEFRLNSGSREPEMRRVQAFWDGGDTWCARFSPDLPGTWAWRTQSSNPEDPGLHHRKGEFLCLSTAGRNAFERHGPLRLSADRHFFVHADGTPFFWMGDTAWNGPLKSNEADWMEYLADRSQEGFNVIQFVAAQWISAAGDAEGRPAYLGQEKIRIEPAFFHRLDRRIDAINVFGMLAAPVLAWAAAWNPDSVHLNPGNTLPEDQLILFVRYLVARYGAHQVAWLLAGDGIYKAEEAERWKRIGRAALCDSRAPATMHPGGKFWAAPEFRNEPWFTFNGYQSGHWNDDDNSRWINEGPVSWDWKTEPVCPQINLEPCYENHLAFTGRRSIDAHSVRRACYWSLLAAPPAGITYGAHGVWSWESVAEIPLSHPHAGIAPCWRDAMRMPGSASMSHLKAIFQRVEWWRLKPCPQLLKDQPGIAVPSAFIAAVCSAERDLGMLYLPEGGRMECNPGFFSDTASVTCFEAATGAVLWTRSFRECAPVIDCGPVASSQERDRVLVIRDKKRGHEE